MLKDLGILVKVGQHANIAGIIGVCEEPGTSRLENFVNILTIATFTYNKRNYDYCHGALRNEFERIFA